jgi:hypothetical protein
MATKKLVPLKKLSDMTKAEARVTVAKDVLSQLRSSELIGQCGTYVGGALHNIAYYNDVGADVREKLGREPCVVCAVGAAAIAFIKRFDGVKVIDDPEDGPRVPDPHEIAGKLFPPKMRDMMESAFETEYCNAAESNRRSDVLDRCIEFGARHYDDTNRLRAIFQNIIDNDGEFKP